MSFHCIRGIEVKFETLKIYRNPLFMDLEFEEKINFIFNNYIYNHIPIKYPKPNFTPLYY